MQDDEEQVLLTETEKDDGGASESPAASPRSAARNTRLRARASGAWFRVYLFALHTALVAAIVGVFACRYDMKTNSVSLAGRTWSPVQQFVEYEINGDHALGHETYSRYSGPPSPEQEEAWERLIRPVYFNATYEDLERAGEVWDHQASLVNGGYVARLGVYHELHCLRNLRLYLFRDRYYPNTTARQEAWLKGHLDHCLESLRLTIMCHGNTALYTFAWDDPRAARPATKSRSQSVCVRWDSIERWSTARMISNNPPLEPPDHHPWLRHRQGEGGEEAVASSLPS